MGATIGSYCTLSLIVRNLTCILLPYQARRRHEVDHYKIHQSQKSHIHIHLLIDTNLVPFNILHRCHFEQSFNACIVYYTNSLCSFRTLSYRCILFSTECVPIITFLPKTVECSSNDIYITVFFLFSSIFMIEIHGS